MKLNPNIGLGKELKCDLEIFQVTPSLKILLQKGGPVFAIVLLAFCNNRNKGVTTHV